MVGLKEASLNEILEELAHRPMDLISMEVNESKHRENGNVDTYNRVSFIGCKPSEMVEICIQPQGSGEIFFDEQYEGPCMVVLLGGYIINGR